MKEKIKKLKEFKILFVEDEKDIIDIISDTLFRLDVKFELASNGKEGLEKLYKNPDINLIVTDINMPIMNGLDMLKAIRDKNIITTCIVMSAHTEKEYKIRAHNLDVKHYIVKPFDFIEFLDIVYKL